jgi:ribosomal protein L35
MPKQKTHKAISKKLNVRAGGSIKIGRPGGNHNTGLKATSFNRKNRKGTVLSKADASRYKKAL